MARQPLASLLIPPPWDFLGAPLHPVATRELVEIFAGWVHERRKAKAADPADAPPPLLVTYLNAHCSNLSARDAAYRGTLRRFHVVYADGKGVVWGALALARPVPERVNAGDFIIDFCRRCARENIRLYLLGCKAGVAEKAAAHWTERAPGLQIAGCRDGYFGEEEEEAVADAVNRSGADIVIAGMSAPRQERWAARNAERLDVAAVWCVGALFEYFSDERKRAPVWMRRAGFEWLFRLIQEPGRLWKRYLVGNAVFALRVLRAIPRSCRAR